MKGIFQNFLNQCAAGVKLTSVATIRSGRSRTAHLNRFMVKAAVRCEGAHQPTAENCVTVFSPGSGTDRSFFDRTTISASGKHVIRHPDVNFHSVTCGIVVFLLSPFYLVASTFSFSSII